MAGNVTLTWEAAQDDKTPAAKIAYLVYQADNEKEVHITPDMPANQVKKLAAVLGKTEATFPVTGATPDGRRARTPLSEGISPVQGADRQGPTAVLRSAAKMDHVRTGGTLLNQKFTPRLLEEEKGIDSLAHLVRTYFKLGGHHIQFNVVDAATLRAAQTHPENHRDLIVRVAGYSDYFCDLGRALQDEIIARSELDAF